MLDAKFVTEHGRTEQLRYYIGYYKSLHKLQGPMLYAPLLKQTDLLY